MAIRKIIYTVGSDGISPKTAQNAGVQGEQNATQVTFVLNNSLISELKYQKEKAGGRLLYRFDTVDAGGFTDRTYYAELTDGVSEVSYSIGTDLSMFGGNAKVYLSITLEKSDSTLTELFSLPAILYFSPRPGAEYEDKEKRSLSTLARIAKECSITAVESRDTSVAAMERTELAQRSLEEGSELIFDGGDSSTELPIGIIVDDELSEVSTNPTQNGLITKRINEIEGNVNTALQSAIEKAVTDAVAAAKNAMYPVGSYYWSTQDTDPSELFGGTWKKVEGRFIIGSGTVTDENTEGIYTFVTGETGGEYTHKLTVSEMPSHEHSYTSINTIQHVQSSTVVNNYGYIGNGSSSSKATSATGGNGHHNNLPPFEVANCWKRIA